MTAIYLLLSAAVGAAFCASVRWLDGRTQAEHTIRIRADTADAEARVTALGAKVRELQEQVEWLNGAVEMLPQELREGLMRRAGGDEPRRAETGI